MLRRPLLTCLLLLGVLGGVHACNQENAPPTAAAVEQDVPTVEAAPEPDAPAPFNPGFIGSACTADADCPYEGGFCLGVDQGFPDGHCSQRCTSTCPDHAGDGYAETMCMTDPSGAPGGICVARCAMHLGASGCRAGYVCASTPRLGRADERMACVPDLGTPAPPTECTEALQNLLLSFTRPDISDGVAAISDAARGRVIERSCQIDTPVLLASPIHHVDFRETGRRLAENLLVSCEMARAVDVMSQVFAELDVVEVEHVGTYNCRGIAGSTRLSAHAEGRALDIKGFERTSGTAVSVLRDWNGRNKEKRAFLRTLVKRLRDSGQFRTVLTPDSNAAHRDHLHVELH